MRETFNATPINKLDICHKSGSNEHKIILIWFNCSQKRTRAQWVWHYLAGKAASWFPSDSSGHVRHSSWQCRSCPYCCQQLFPGMQNLHLGLHLAQITWSCEDNFQLLSPELWRCWDAELSGLYWFLLKRWWGSPLSPSPSSTFSRPQFRLKTWNWIQCFTHGTPTKTQVKHVYFHTCLFVLGSVHHAVGSLLYSVQTLEFLNAAATLKKNTPSK